MDNNNLYGQGNQNPEQTPQQPYQQPQQQAPNQGFDNNSQQQPYNQYYQPYQQSQQSYSQSYQQQPYQSDTELEEPVSFGDWMLSMLLMMIPCVNIIMMFEWAFGSGTKKSKSNYFKAVLVWTLIWTVLWIVIMIGIGGMMAAFSNSYYY